MEGKTGIQLHPSIWCGISKLGMPHEFSTSYIEDSLSAFRYYENLAERGMAQVTDEQLVAAMDVNWQSPSMPRRK
jgi:hypothetical protein